MCQEDLARLLGPPPASLRILTLELRFECSFRSQWPRGSASSNLARLLVGQAAATLQHVALDMRFVLPMLTLMPRLLHLTLELRGCDDLMFMAGLRPLIGRTCARWCCCGAASAEATTKGSCIWRPTGACRPCI